MKRIRDIENWMDEHELDLMVPISFLAFVGLFYGAIYAVYHLILLMQ